MWAAETLPKSAILAIPADEPERLFGPDPGAIATLFRALVKRWHPDQNKAADAGAIFEKIVQLRDVALARAAGGDWRTPGLMNFVSVDGKAYEIRFRRRHTFDLGEIYVGVNCVVYALTKDAADLALMADCALARLTYLTPDMRETFEKRFASLIKIFTTADRIVYVFRKTSDQILLRDLLAHCGGRLDPKHVAWIVSELESLTCFLELPHVGLVHPALGPENLLVSPRLHSVAIVGDWWYAAPIGEKLVAAPPRAMAHFPKVLVDDGVAKLRLTLEAIRLTACEALGYPNAVVIKTPDVPQPLKKWLLDPPMKSAIADYATWCVARDASFGPRRFIEFPINPEAVYPRL